MNNQALQSYLKGSADNLDQVRRTLATQGPQIVVPILSMELSLLKGWGQFFLKPPEGLSAVGVAMAQRDAENVIDHICNRTLELVAEIGACSVQSGKMVGEQILTALGDRNADIRALAALYSTIKCIPSSIVSPMIVRLYFNDQDSLVKVGAAIAMVGLPDIPDRVFEDSAELVKAFLQVVAFQNFPTLVTKVRRALYNQDEGFQNIMIATRSLFYMIAAR
jgi:hypothetical protein